MSIALLRALIIVLVLAGFLAIAAPLQRVAQARSWQLSRWLPIFFSRTICRLLRVRVRFHGKPCIARPRILVANHVSWLDIMALGARDPLCFLAKREVA